MADAAYETSYGDKRKDGRRGAAQEGSRREEAQDRREAPPQRTILGGMAKTKADVERAARRR